MTLEEVYYVSQVVSTIVLVLSVIYLGRQTQLAAKSNVAQMHQARSQQHHEVILKLTDPEFGPLATAGMHGDLDLSNEQIRRFYFFAVTLLRIQEEMFRQWREGAIATDRWKTTERLLASMISAPGYRSCYWALQRSFDKEFTNLVGKMIDSSGPAGPFDLEAEWRAGVRRAISGGNANPS